MQFKDFYFPADHFLLIPAEKTVAEARQMMDLETRSLQRVIIDRTEGDQKYYYFFDWFDLDAHLRAAPEQIMVKKALQLREEDREAMVDAKEDKDLVSARRGVVMEDGKMTGFFDLDWYDPDGGMGPPETVVEDEENGGSSKGGEDFFPGEKGVDDTESFSAFPSISDPGPLAPEAEFEVTVGFSEEKDETLENVVAIHIEKPEENAFLEVSLMPVGATVKNNKLKQLPLDLDAKTTFRCQVNPGAREVTLMATYLYKRQPVGTATRRIPVGAAETSEAPAPARPGLSTTTPAVKHDSRCQLKLPQYEFSELGVDLTAIIRWDEVAQKLIWKIIAPEPAIDVDAETRASNTREFAAQIIQELARVGFKGQLGLNALTTLGQNIAGIMPEVFFTAIAEVHQALRRVPRLLIWTDEPYVPWELAVSRHLRLDPAFLPVLQLQVEVGRWWISDQVVAPPPIGINLEKISVLAADYPLDSSQVPLEEALKEKQFLIDEFQATPIPARTQDILDLTVNTPPHPGHLLHMALHGTSRPQSNEQFISLEDGDVSANQLFGLYFCGDVPAISFLFLNACQVGTGGSTLGQASGFPGIMLMNGVQGFLSPLWNVHDDVARPLAEKFYQQAVSQGRRVGEVLLELHRELKPEVSLTPLAYIFYGHPSLQLKK